jgi:hypothetical protein
VRAESRWAKVVCQVLFPSAGRDAGAVSRRAAARAREHPPPSHALRSTTAERACCALVDSGWAARRSASSHLALHHHLEPHLDIASGLSLAERDPGRTPMGGTPRDASRVASPHHVSISPYEVRARRCRLVHVTGRCSAVSARPDEPAHRSPCSMQPAPSRALRKRRPIGPGTRRSWHKRVRNADQSPWEEVCSRAHQGRLRRELVPSRCVSAGAD